jgi:hypothetical protein
MRVEVAVWMWFLMACGSGPAGPTEPAVKAQVGLPAGLDKALHDKLCADPCAGLGAITIWRDTAGDVGLLVFQGDLSKCSHVMKTWQTPTGEVLLSLSDRPVSRDEAAKNRAKIPEIQAGLREDRVLNCGS